jgi:hypothetical protein
MTLFICPQCGREFSGFGEIDLPESYVDVEFFCFGTEKQQNHYFLVTKTRSGKYILRKINKKQNKTLQLKTKKQIKKMFYMKKIKKTFVPG